MKEQGLLMILVCSLLLWSNMVMTQDVLNQDQLSGHIVRYQDESIDINQRENALEKIVLHYSAVQPDSMLIWVKDGQKTFEQSENELYKTWLIVMEGKFYFQKAEYAASRPYYYKAISLSQEPDAQKNLADAYEGLSQSYLYGNAQDSVTYYGLQALDIYEELRDTSSRIQILLNFYQVQNQIRNLDDALTYLNEAYRLIYQSKATQWYGNANISKGIYYYSLASKVEYTDSLLYHRSLDSSLLYLNKGAEACRIEGNKQREAIALANSGLVYQEKLQWSKGYEAFVQARDLAMEFNNQDYIIGFERGMAHNLSKMGNPEKALPILLRASEHFKNSQNAAKVADAYNNISQAYADMGNYERALHYKNGQLNTQLEAYDSLTIKRINELEAKYETEKKEAEINRLSLEDDLNQSKLSRQRIALGGAVIGLTLLSLLLYKIIGQNRKIHSQNQIISKSLVEKETLLKEIHHRVKNNMQVISSLLRIQTNQTTDAGALSALKEGQSRVQSMSLIHQDLYQHNNLTGIHMPDYIDKLGRSLLQTYQLSPDRVIIQTDVDDLTLDVDTVVPLGLIINELIANALKYAFPNGGKGILKISLVEQGQQLILTVADDGVGISNFDKDKGFGSGLIQAFARKLDGKLNIDSITGTTVTLTIRDYQKVVSNN